MFFLWHYVGLYNRNSTNRNRNNEMFMFLFISFFTKKNIIIMDFYVDFLCWQFFLQLLQNLVIHFLSWLKLEAEHKKIQSQKNNNQPQKRKEKKRKWQQKVNHLYVQVKTIEDHKHINQRIFHTQGSIKFTSNLEKCVTRRWRGEYYYFWWRFSCWCNML